MFGTLLLVASLLILGVALYVSIKKETWKLFALNDKVKGKLKAKGLTVSEGDEGVAVSAIRPSGEALFGDETIEVHSRGGFIDVNSKIKITLMEGNKIYVKLI